MWQRAVTVGGGGKAAFEDIVHTYTQGQGSTTPITTGFEPIAVIVVSSNYYYSYYKGASATTVSVCPNSAWAGGADRYSGTVQNNVIVPTSTGFNFTPVTSSDMGVDVKVFAY